MPKSTPHFIPISKADVRKQIVYGEIYIPNSIDAQNDMMTREGIEKMAHNYLRLRTLGQSIDENHNNFPAGAYPVESFIVRKGDPDFTNEGAWILGVKITDPVLWKKVVKGTIAGFSLEGKARKVNAKVEVIVKTQQFGETAPDEEDGHTHYWWAKIDPVTGKVIKGFTSEENGHTHIITKGTATNMTGGHKHRFTLHEP